LTAKSATEVAFEPCEGLAAQQLRKFRRTTLLSYTRCLRGEMSLHGSAVASEAGAIVFVGDSGAGKSTAAMSLSEHFGCEFLADDVVPIDWREDQVRVPPVDDDFWLAPASAEWFGLEGPTSGKLSVAPRARSEAPVRALAIVHLEFGDGAPTVEAARGADAFRRVSGAHLCPPLSRSDDVTMHFEARARLAAAVPLLRLRRPRSLPMIEVASRALFEYLIAYG
jgi:hypothetical protein